MGEQACGGQFELLYYNLYLLLCLSLNTFLYFLCDNKELHNLDSIELLYCNLLELFSHLN